MFSLKRFPWRLRWVKYESGKVEGTVRVGGTVYLYNPGVQDKKKPKYMGWCNKCHSHTPWKSKLNTLYCCYCEGMIPHDE